MRLTLTAGERLIRLVMRHDLLHRGCRTFVLLCWSAPRDRVLLFICAIGGVVVEAALRDVAAPSLRGDLKGHVVFVGRRQVCHVAAEVLRVLGLKGRSRRTLAIEGVSKDSLIGLVHLHERVLKSVSHVRSTVNEHKGRVLRGCPSILVLTRLISEHVRHVCTQIALGLLVGASCA